MFEGQRITVLPATTDRWVDFDKLMGKPGGYWGPLAPSTDGRSADFRAAFSPAGNPAPDRGGKRRYRNRTRDSAADRRPRRTKRFLPDRKGGWSQTY